MIDMNVALLGHVDAGKTTLARVLTEIASTAAFNHAEGRENTQDLGYSSLSINNHRVVLIDCPGHAALIRAVVAASSVIDGAIIVISSIKGIEPQTAEHLLLASLCCPHTITVVITKVDLATKEQLESTEKSIRRAMKTLGVKEISMIRVRLIGDDKEIDDGRRRIRENIELMMNNKCSQEPETASSPSPLIAVDHCFSIKGKGSVLTGSVLYGRVKVGSEIEIGQTKEKRKVKELQSWKENVIEVSRGERVAMLVSSLESPISRCIVGPPGGLSPLIHIRATVTTIPFFRFPIKDGAKVHISCGYETEMATVRFGRCEEGADDGSYELLSTLSSPCTVFVHLSHPLFSPIGSFYIASRLELETKGCRFAFYGKLENSIDNEEPKFFSRQRREGEIERVHDNRTVIVKDLFKKETKHSLFNNMPVRLSIGLIGRIDGPFGSSGKTRIVFNNSLSEEEMNKMKEGGVKVWLYLKKWLSDRKMTGYLPEKWEDNEE